MYEIKVQKKSFALELGKKNKNKFCPKTKWQLPLPYHANRTFGNTELRYTESLVR